MMDEHSRPDPDALLKQISEDSKDEKRGRLTIFFGYSPGVGKTYSMLYDAAIRKKEEGMDVVIGYVELHKRPDTVALLQGFEKIPPLLIDHNGITLIEPDIAGIMKRKPDIALIDELAHTNAPASRHQKRFQDINELLDMGINVYTTLNVQHIESLKDLVAQIISIKVTENVPDPVFLDADEVKLIDLPIDDLLKRLKDGKIYTEDMASQAVGKFFKSGNLLALRQLAAKQVALRIDKQMASYVRTKSLEGEWQPREKVLVGISASPHAERLIRSAYRLSVELDAELTALHIDTSEYGHLIPEENRKWIKNAFDVAAKLGVKTAALEGKNFAAQIANYASINKITKIVIGKPDPESKLESVDTILSRTEGVDVYIFAGYGDAARAGNYRPKVKDPITEMMKQIKLINRKLRLP
jgi:two-component system, OmpR family, sensor histidine kinase KdpD